MLKVSLLSLALAARAPAGDFTATVWTANQDVYQQILAHPFLTSLQDGSLDRRTFAFYLIQDAFYLGEFARALEATAQKAPKAEWAALLREHARETLTGELGLHKEVLRDYGLSLEEQAATEPTPEAFAYTSYILAVTHSRSFGEALSVLLPCYWIYWEVGKDLARRGSPEPSYQRWIDQYAAKAYGETVHQVLAIADEVARSASPEELENMRKHFRRASIYEWMFWDSAYHQRRWPISVRPDE